MDAAMGLPTESSAEGTPETKRVEVAATQTEFMMTPPGTSAQIGNLTILIRSVDWDKESVSDNQGNSRLLTRCIDLLGSGSISRGTWDNQQALLHVNQRLWP